MKYIKKRGEVYIPQKATKLSEVDIQPGDKVYTFEDDGTPYGVCGAVYATQVDSSRQIENKPSLSLE